jgi:hypothetical protein
MSRTQKAATVDYLGEISIIASIMMRLGHCAARNGEKLAGGELEWLGQQLDRVQAIALDTVSDVDRPD